MTEVKMKMYVLGHPDMPAATPANGKIGVLDGSGIMANILPENTVAAVHVDNTVISTSGCTVSRAHFVDRKDVSQMGDAMAITAAVVQSILADGAVEMVGLYGEVLDRILALAFPVDVKEVCIRHALEKKRVALKASILSHAVVCTPAVFALLLESVHWNRQAMWQAAMMSAASGCRENLALLLEKIQKISPLTAAEEAMLKTAKSVSGVSNG